MKKSFIAAALFLAVSFSALAQDSPKMSRDEYAGRYEMLVKRLGPEGVGIETLLQKWGKDYPEDMDMLLGKFTYYLSKSRKPELVQKEGSRYLGNAPALTLKDSLDRDVNYFQVDNYDGELFRQAIEAIDKAIEVSPLRLDCRLYKISALIGAEKESPEESLSDLCGLIDYNAKGKPSWEYPGLEKVDDEVFSASVQEFCFAFYSIGTPEGFEAFRKVSEKMLDYYPKDYTYMTNIGSYHFVYKHDNKTALKYYNKVLKKNPDDYATIKNCVLLARNSKDVKLEKKYLPMLIKVSDDEAEIASAKARLESL